MPKRPRCLNPFVHDDPRTIKCDRPNGHKGRHRAEWESQYDDEAT